MICVRVGGLVSVKGQCGDWNPLVQGWLESRGDEVVGAQGW